MFNHTDNTILAKEKLAKLTSKEVIVLSLDQLSEILNDKSFINYFGMAYETSSNILIGLNSHKPHTYESTFVHEILHIILKYEGYPNIVITDISDKSPLYNVIFRLRNNFHSTIEHPIVYYRMSSEFTLNMQDYFSSLFDQKINRFKRKIPSDQKIFYYQQDLLDSIEYHFYEKDYAAKLLNKIKKRDFLLYKFSHKIIKNYPSPSSASPSEISNIFHFIKDMIKYYGKRHNNRLNYLWDHLTLE